MKKSEKVWFILFVIYLCSTFGTMLFLSKQAWIIVFLVSFSAWFVVPVLIRRKEKKEQEH